MPVRNALYALISVFALAMSAAPLALAVPASAGTSAMPTSSAVPTPAPYPGAFVAASALKRLASTPLADLASASS